MAPAVDSRLTLIRRQFRAEADAEHARFHRDYHKSALRFHGLRIPRVRAIVRSAFPARPPLTRVEHLPLAQTLWREPWHEERFAALILLQRLGGDLRTADLGWLRAMTHTCDGWGLLDPLAIHVIGRLALARGRRVYETVKPWARDPWMWTRRAALLIHVLPARQGKLDRAHALATIEELRGERERFLRKAVVWLRREARL